MLSKHDIGHLVGVCASAAAIVVAAADVRGACQTEGCTNGCTCYTTFITDSGGAIGELFEVSICTTLPCGANINAGVPKTSRPNTKQETFQNINEITLQCGQDGSQGPGSFTGGMLYQTQFQNVQTECGAADPPIGG